MKDNCINPQCEREIDLLAEVCPYCGCNQFGCINKKNDPFVEPRNPRMKKKRRGYSDEEILALGLYPDNECYKMSLISRILGK